MAWVFGFVFVAVSKTVMYSFWAQWSFGTSGTNPTSDKVSHLRRLESSTTLLWESQMPNSSWLNAGWFKRKGKYFLEVTISVTEKKKFLLTYRPYFVKKKKRGGGQPTKHQFCRRSNKNRILRNFPLYCKQIICASKILSVW